MLPAPAVFTLKGTRYSGNLIPAAPAVLLIRAKRKNQHFIWFASELGVILPSTSRSRAAVARRAHNPKVGGSIPPFATKQDLEEVLFLYLCGPARQCRAASNYM